MTLIQWELADQVYILRLISFKEFLNVANEEKFTILRAKLLQTFATRSLKSFPACSCGSS